MARPYRFEISLPPPNGHVHRATVTTLGDGDAVLYADRVDLKTATEREGLAKRLAKRLEVVANGQRRPAFGLRCPSHARGYTISRIPSHL